jgi:hypothetical protein
MAIPDTGYIFEHPNSINLYIIGPAFTGGQGVPTNASMTGVKATDLAYCKTRFGASIRLNGLDTTAGTLGLAFPNGMGGYSRVLIESRTRYSLDFGFNGSHASSRGQSRVRLESCAVFGGVWGVIGKNAHLTLAGSNWFGYQISGGPIGGFGGYLDLDSSSFQAYCPTSNTADNPKYVVYADGMRLYVNAGSTNGLISAKGSFLHGLFALNGSSGFFRAAAFDGVTMPFSLASNVDISGFSITNANPANTTFVPGTTQPGMPGNEGTGSLISSGRGGNVMCSGGAITNSVAQRYLSCNSGGYQGYNALTITGSKATITAFSFNGSKGNTCSAVITSPQGGSVDQSIASTNGDVFWFGSTSSFAMSPALNIPTNGSGNYA